MTELGYREDQKITDVIREKDFTLSAEIIPPRNGSEVAKIMSQISQLVSAGSQFMAVTKGAGGSLRGGSLPIAQHIKNEAGLPCIAHFTCRDITPQEIENQLIDHHYFGIRNILALRGDPPQGQPNWQPKEGSFNYAYQLIEQIKNLNEGIYLPRPNGPEIQKAEKTSFCIGAAVYPEHPEPNERIEFFKKKVEAGAEYAISQMIFDSEAYDRFLTQCEKKQISIPILPGTRLLKSQKQALNMARRFGVSIPQSTLDALPETASAESLNQCLDYFYEFVEKLRKVGSPGIHLFVITDTEPSALALKHLSQTYK